MPSAALQQDAPARSGSAERQRRYRQRQADGDLAVGLALPAWGRGRLERLGWLSPSGTDADARAALAAFVDGALRRDIYAGPGAGEGNGPIRLGSTVK